MVVALLLTFVVSVVVITSHGKKERLGASATEAAVTVGLAKLRGSPWFPVILTLVAVTLAASTLSSKTSVMFASLATTIAFVVGVVSSTLNLRNHCSYNVTLALPMVYAAWSA